jgi:hypothetical protein
MFDALFDAHIYIMGLIYGFCAYLHHGPHFRHLRMFAAHITAWASFLASAHVCCAYLQHGPHCRLLRILEAQVN